MKSGDDSSTASIETYRYKTKPIHYFADKIYHDNAPAEVDRFMSVINQLFQAYVSSPLVTSKKTSTANVQTVDSQPLDQEVEDEGSDDELDADLERFLHGSSAAGQGTKTELEVYMEQPLVEWKTKGKVLYDVLSWWKLKQPELPILSQLARDVLSIQVSTVASESAFSAGGRVVDPFRSRLDPEVVQALICTKDWTAASRKGGDIGGSILTEMDMEGIERCFASLATLQEHEDYMDDLEEDVLEDMDE